MTTAKIAIIGAGMTGLTAAKLLTANGWSVDVFDKGRGVGGRMATRRQDPNLRFNHGVRYLAPLTEAFQSFLDPIIEAGILERWQENPLNDEISRWVGRPGMNQLAKYLAKDLHVRTSVQIDQLQRHPGGWSLVADEIFGPYEQVILTVPAPQAASLLESVSLLEAGALLEGTPEIQERVASIHMDPCLTLMVATQLSDQIAVKTTIDPEADIPWISPHPGQDLANGLVSWVAQASPAFSRRHLELDFDEMAEIMLPRVLEAIGASFEQVIYAKAHRWRYTSTPNPLGTAFLQNEAGTLYLGGDWCLGSRVEHAWESGRAIAQQIISGGSCDSGDL